MSNLEDKIKRLQDNSSSNKMLINAILSAFKKENIKLFIIIFCICLIPSYYISFSSKTLDIFSNLIDMFLNLILAVFGTVLTAFALLQAFVTKNIIKLIYDSNHLPEEGKKNKMLFEIQETNLNFVYVLMLNLICIIIIVFIYFFIEIIPQNFLLFNNLMFSNTICFVLSTFFITFIIFSVVSIKSIIRDLYGYINLEILSTILEIEDDSLTEKEPAYDNDKLYNKKHEIKNNLIISIGKKRK